LNRPAVAGILILETSRRRIRVSGEIRVRPRSGDNYASGLVGFPLLLQCDHHGQVIWVSDRMRFFVGEPQTLAELLQSRRLLEVQPHFRLFEVLEAPEGPLLAAETDEIEASFLEQAQELHGLEWKLLQAYFRLQVIERHLALRAARQRPGAGRVAIRQIELERRHLGLELHTGVGQMLAAIRLQLEIVSAHLIDSPNPVREALDNIATLAGNALDEIRSVSRRLHPPDWQRLTIEDALTQLWNITGIPLSFQADLRLEPLPREPEPDVKALIYRTAQEGLSNIIGHAKARRVSMSIASSADSLVLTVQDDGSGFEPASLADASASLAGGLGLRSLSEQAMALGAKIDVESGENGTKLVLTTHFSVEP
jgi:signal transduction histidine kinase